MSASVNCPDLAKSQSFGYSSSLSLLAVSEYDVFPKTAFRSIPFLDVPISALVLLESPAEGFC